LKYERIERLYISPFIAPKLQSKCAHENKDNKDNKEIFLQRSLSIDQERNLKKPDRKKEELCAIQNTMNSSILKMKV